MNKNDLKDKISEKCSVSKADASRMLDVFIEACTEALSKGDDIRLSAFGTLSISVKAARTGRNPRTGAEIQIPSKKVIKFKAASKLLEDL